MVKDGEASEQLSEWLEQVRDTEAQLTAGLPDDPAAWDATQQGRWLLAQLLEWHRREEKPGYWRYFHLLEDLTDEERREEREPLAMLELIGPEDETRRTYRYRFPPQEHEIGDHGGVDPVSGKTFGVVEVDDLRGGDRPALREDLAGRRPPHVARSGARRADHGDAEEPPAHRTGHRRGRAGGGRALPGSAGPPGAPAAARRGARSVARSFGGAGQSAEDAAHALVTRLDRSYLAIQGPPGSGKTWTGARLILDLVAEGRKVGVTANSHKVIGKVLDDVMDAARKDPRFAGRLPRLGQKPGRGQGADLCGRAGADLSGGRVAKALAADEVDVVGGTAWLWASDKLVRSVDVLVIDEAGQFSLANAVAVSAAADSLVLLGDPQQLDQPTQGTHPPGAGRSALAHLLAEQATMPGHLGLFMDRTWRLHPDICAYTSEVFYEGKLEPQDGNEKQGLSGVPPT